MNLWIAIIVMALATYLLRAVPLVATRRRITNRWLLSFLYYVPYAVLTAMTVPAIIFATRHPLAGAIALLVAVLLALRGRSLLVVAIGAAASVLVTEALLSLV
ncbi:MAG: AzlD domain-containing protein [Brooklawnia sp.]|jgi:branched-subunit amino acid transport protein